MIKLTEDNVRQMRKLRNNGWTLSKLGVKFNIDHTQVGHIVRGEQWKHIK
jgi:hypothetical protein